MSSQCAAAVLMVRPASFGFNPETADSNRFARAESGARIAEQARVEFDHFAQALAQSGVRVCIVEDTAPPARPDAVFPNNWVSFHADGTVVLYPMQAPNRRRERRMEVLSQVQQALGFRCLHLLDLSPAEEQGHFLEGTGSLVLDHVHRVAYACRSLRTDAALAREWCAALRYELEIFDASDAGGSPIYHTNVLLAIGARFAVLCSAALAPADRDRVRQRLAATGRTLLELDRAAMCEFAGNILELRTGTPSGPDTVLVMSQRAQQAFGPEGRERLQAVAGSILAVSIPLIETVGGGSARCMLAEVPEVRT